MPTPQDEEFVRFAVANGALTQDQGEEALQALRDIEELGGSASAPDMLVKRGVLDERQVGQVRQAMAATKAAGALPKELGGFELLEKIGQGGMGAVFKARQSELDRIVALKVLSPRLAGNKEFVERFFREARAAGRLSHPHIVAAIDVGESQGFYYFAMEFVAGETVSRLLAREGPLPEARAIAIAADVARALDHAHKKALIHRDIKPDNIMVTPDGRVRVTDFGLAKALDADAAGDGSKFLGTPAYVAPEHLRSDPDIDCRADIFSLGVTLFQMLTGEPPFHGANPMAIAAAVASDPLPSIRRIRPDVSIATTRIVERMTAKDRAHRFATPAEVVAALEARAKAPRAAARPVARPAARPPALPGAKAPAKATAPAPRARAARRRSHLATIITIILIVGGNAAIFVFFSHKLLRRRRRKAVAPPPIEQPLPQPKTKTSVVVEPPDPAPIGEALLRQLSAAMDSARALAPRDPRGYKSHIARLEQVLAGFPPEKRRQLPAAGHDLIQKANSEIQRLKDGLKEAADAEIETRSRKAETLLGEGKINEAIGLLSTFPSELRTPEASAKLQTRLTLYRQRAIASFEAVDAKGKQLIEQGNFEGAKAAYAPYTSCVVRQIASRAARALSDIEQKAAKQSAEARRVAQAAYRKSAAAILDRLEARDYDEARKLVDAAVVDPKLAPLREKLQGLDLLVRGVKEVWAYAEIAVKKLKPGEKIRMGGLAGEFLEFQDGMLHLKFGSVRSGRRLSKLRPAELIDLALRGYGKPSPQADAKLGLFLLAEREYALARTRLEAARAQGANIAKELDLLTRFSPRECSTCKGAKKVTCPKCNGTGIGSRDRVRCPVCDGRRGGPCAKCRGDGRAPCSNCGGTGRVGGTYCMVCGGRGQVKCKRCGGDGYATCRNCKAEGYITRTTPCAKCKNKKTLTCPMCRGKGSFPPPDLTAPGTP
jgi:tRNA A-37 threonylcarbamoyl transferase component Bud32